MEDSTKKTGDYNLPTIEADRLERLADEFAEKMMEGADTETETPESLASFSDQFKNDYYEFMMARYVVVSNKDEPAP